MIIGSSRGRSIRLPGAASTEKGRPMKKLAISVATAIALAATIASMPAQARGLGLASGVIAGAIAAGIAADAYANEGYGYYGPRNYRSTYFDEPGYRYHRSHRGWRHGW